MFSISNSFSNLSTFSLLIFFLSKDLSHNTYNNNSFQILFGSKFILFQSADISFLNISFIALLFIISLFSSSIFMSRFIGNCVSEKTDKSVILEFSHHFKLLFTHSFISHSALQILISFFSKSKISLTKLSKSF